MAIRSWRSSVAGPGQRDPLRDLVVRRIDHCESWLCLVGGEYPTIIHRQRNALSVAAHRYDRQHFPGFEVQHRDRPGSDICRVTAAAILGDGEHVRLRLSGGD